MSARILTADDSRIIRMIIRKALEPYECTVLEASNGQECIDIAAREKPDLIVLDLTMPVMDGIEALLLLKKNPDLAHIPVIILSAEAGREAKVTSVVPAGSCAAILSKPFRESQFIERVKKVFHLELKSS